MDCSAVRESMSALLDHEAPAVSNDMVTFHLDRCNGCRAWSAAAERTHRTFRIAPADPVPDLTPAILQAINSDRRSPADAIRPLRLIIACCALLQLCLTIPAFVETAGAPIHLDHELGAWDAALAFGFLFAAWRPERAWGMLPLVGAIGATLAVTGIIDAATGHTTLNGESAHIVELLGFFFLWMLVRARSAHDTVASRLHFA
jgi:predicted anti-sigma-YlaC factor YlaD